MNIGTIASIAEDLSNVFIDAKKGEQLKFKPGDEVEIKKITADYKIYLKLNGLWHKFINTYSKETGDKESQIKYELKARAGFGDIITTSRGQQVFVPWEFSYNSTTWQQRSNLMRVAIDYCSQNYVFDVFKFAQEYFEITGGKSLI